MTIRSALAAMSDPLIHQAMPPKKRTAAAVETRTSLEIKCITAVRREWVAAPVILLNRRPAEPMRDRNIFMELLERLGGRGPVLLVPVGASGVVRQALAVAVVGMG